MATRAERFKAAAERSGEKRETSKPGKKSQSGKAARSTTNGLSAKAKSIVSAEGPDSARSYGGMSTAARNQKKLQGGRGQAGKALYVLEDSRADKAPSRKSTRKSKAHVKSATPLTARTQRRVSSPKARHDRRSK